MADKGIVAPGKAAMQRRKPAALDVGGKVSVLPLDLGATHHAGGAAAAGLGIAEG